MLVVFYENLPETYLSLVVSESMLIFFVGQILNSRIVFILGRMEYAELQFCVRVLLTS